MSIANRIELRHVRAFLALAEELNFRSAAKRLHITEPPLSRTIAQLEEVIGSRLFERTSRRCQLTAAGLQLIAPAKRIVEIIQRDFGAAIATEERRVLRLGVLIYSNPVQIETMRLRLQARTTRDVQITFARSHELERMVVKGKLDYAVVQRAPGKRAAGTVRLTGANLIVALKSDHALARRPALRLRDLQTFENLLFLTRRQNAALFDYVHGEIVRRVGRSPAYASVKEIFEGQALIAAGSACTLVPETVRGFTQDEIALRPLVPQDRIRTDLCLVSASSKPDELHRATVNTVRTFLVKECGLGE